MTETTTIEIKRDTWRQLNAQKDIGDSFDDVIRQLLQADDGVVESKTADVESESKPRVRDGQVAIGDDLPQQVDPGDARDVVAAALHVIDVHGPLERSAIVDQLGKERSLGYDMRNRDGAWWKRIVAPGIKANGAEHQPGRGWTR